MFETVTQTYNKHSKGNLTIQYRFNVSKEEAEKEYQEEFDFAYAPHPYISDTFIQRNEMLPPVRINNIYSRENFPIIVDAYIRVAEILTKLPNNIKEVTHYTGSFTVTEEQYPHMPFFEVEMNRDVVENSCRFGGYVDVIESPDGYQGYMDTYCLGKKDFMIAKNDEPKTRKLYFMAERIDQEWTFIIRCKSDYFNNTFACLDYYDDDSYIVCLSDMSM